MIEFGSVCSGIEAASVAWEPLGFQATWLSEIEKFPTAVLAHHWPHVPNLGDMTQIAGWMRTGALPAPEVLVGGTPCQAFSVAGKRGGMDDPRGQLTLVYVDLLNAIDEQRRRKGQPEAVCVWENVPGVLSDKDNAFGCFLAALVGEQFEIQPGEKPDVGKENDFWKWDKKRGVHRAKWSNAGEVFGPERSVAWRVLDAQYFGVAQRRRRVFLVASARDGFDCGAVLFESEGVRRDSPPSREAREGVAALTANGVGTCGADDNQAQAGHLTVGAPCARTGQSISAQDAGQGHLLQWPAEIASTLNASFGDKQGLEDQHINGGAPLFVAAHRPPVCFDARQDPLVYGDIGGPVNATSPQSNAIVYPIHDKTTRHAGASGKGSGNGFGVGAETDPAPTLTSGDRHAVGYGFQTRIARNGRGDMGDLAVRRLTPIECARLQGFPDGHTLIPWRGKAVELCPGGPQYKAYGNSKAVPVVRWVGARLKNNLK